jgi:hypothetical protein
MAEGCHQLKMVVAKLGQAPQPYPVPPQSKTATAQTKIFRVHPKTNHAHSAQTLPTPNPQSTDAALHPTQTEQPYPLPHEKSS